MTPVSWTHRSESDPPNGWKVIIEGATDAVEEEVDVTCISRLACCKVCAASRACGDSCISSGFSCSKGIGCACDDEEVC